MAAPMMIGPSSARAALGTKKLANATAPAAIRLVPNG
jgi:hypothetical protein